MSVRLACTAIPVLLATSPLVTGAQTQQQPQQFQQQQNQQFQQQQAQAQLGAQGAQAQQPQVVATVNGDAITRREVEVNLQRQLQQLQAQQPQQPIDGQVLQQIRPQVVDSLIESRLIEQYAIEQGPDVEDEEVDQSIGHLQQQLTAQGSSLQQFLATQGHTEESFKTRIKGSIAWHKLQQEQLTEENLTRFFNENREQFNAESLDQVRQEVTNAYVGELWKQIIEEEKPQAEIRTAGRQPANGLAPGGTSSR